MLAFRRTSTTSSISDPTTVQFGLYSVLSIHILRFYFFLFLMWSALAITCMLWGMLFGGVHIWWLVTEGHWFFKRHRLVCNRCWSAYFRVVYVHKKRKKRVYEGVYPARMSIMRNKPARAFGIPFSFGWKNLTLQLCYN